MTCSPTWSTSDRSKTRQAMFHRRTRNTFMWSFMTPGDHVANNCECSLLPLPFSIQHIGEPSNLTPDVGRQGTSDRPNGEPIKRFRRLQCPNHPKQNRDVHQTLVPKQKKAQSHWSCDRMPCALCHGFIQDCHHQNANRAMSEFSPPRPCSPLSRQHRWSFRPCSQPGGRSRRANGTTGTTETAT